MASPGDQGAAKAKHLRVLLPFTCDTLRISDELAADIGVEVALVVGPEGGKGWPVEVGEDGDGAFLGRGWPEFAEAYGAGAGWLLVLRHRGRGVLFAKAFDTTCCLRELVEPASPQVQATSSSKASTHKPQFVRVLPKDFMEKMLIPAKFVQQYIHKEFLDQGTATVLGPIAKVFSIKHERGQSGMFFAGGWSQFLKFQHVTEANALLLRYEGNMVFTLKVFETNGNQRVSKHKQNINTMKETEEQQEAPSASIQRKQEISSSSRKRKSKSNWPSTDRQRRLEGPKTSSELKSTERNCAYGLGPPAWLTKKINTSMMRKHHLTVPRPFCNAIGLQKHCMIRLQDSMGSNISWQVHGKFYKNGDCQLGSGWKKFCQDIGLKNGDVLTIRVIQTQLWDVIITRS